MGFMSEGVKLSFLLSKSERRHFSLASSPLFSYRKITYKHKANISSLYIKIKVV